MKGELLNKILLFVCVLYIIIVIYAELVLFNFSLLTLFGIWAITIMPVVSGIFIGIAINKKIKNL